MKESVYNDPFNHGRGCPRETGRQKHIQGSLRLLPLRPHSSYVASEGALASARRIRLAFPSPAGQPHHYQKMTASNSHTLTKSFVASLSHLIMRVEARTTHAVAGSLSQGDVGAPTARPFTMPDCVQRSLTTLL